MPKKMTKDETIAQLVETRTISTAMLEPLGYSFESFLRLAQMPKDAREGVISQLIEFYTSDKARQVKMIREAKAEIAAKGK